MFLDKVKKLTVELEYPTAISKRFWKRHCRRKIDMYFQQDISKENYILLFRQMGCKCTKHHVHFRLSSVKARSSKDVQFPRISNIRLNEKLAWIGKAKASYSCWWQKYFKYYAQTKEKRFHFLQGSKFGKLIVNM